MREEASGRWDLVISAPWLEAGKLKALGEFVEKLSDRFGQEEAMSFSRIVTLNSDDPALHTILEEVAADRIPYEEQGTGLFGLPIEHAVILRVRRETEA